MIAARGTQFVVFAAVAALATIKAGCSNNYDEYNGVGNIQADIPI